MLDNVLQRCVATIPIIYDAWGSLTEGIRKILDGGYGFAAASRYTS